MLYEKRMWISKPWPKRFGHRSNLGTLPFKPPSRQVRFHPFLQLHSLLRLEINFATLHSTCFRFIFFFQLIPLKHYPLLRVVNKQEATTAGIGNQWGGAHMRERGRSKIVIEIQPWYWWSGGLTPLFFLLICGHFHPPVSVWWPITKNDFKFVGPWP